MTVILPQAGPHSLSRHPAPFHRHPDEVRTSFRSPSYCRRHDARSLYS